MILPLEELKKKIVSEGNITEADLHEKIKKKMEELAGLISEEGAAHIVANELGVQLLAKTSNVVKISGLQAGMRNIDILGKVTRKYEVRTFESNRGAGKVGSFVLADESGSIRGVLWNNQADKLASFNQGDVLKIKSGYIRDNRGTIELHVNDRTEIAINPEGETVNVSVTSQPSTGGSAQRKNIKELKEGDQNVEILVTIVDAFDIRFFTPRFNVPENETNPISYVLNVIGDDGTDTMRITLWKNQIEQLLNMDSASIVQYKEFPERFQDVKHKLLGEMVKLVGRVKKNDMFDRLEFNVQTVQLNPDPKEELKRLEEKNQPNSA